jgi:2-polyprenyl-6-methoxyphenol hydroxylase-like FAD-dependent oxidoreductase
MHDVIVVGTRVAGAATAMLLAREGVSVLAVDRAAFPSDTLSTHQVQVPGIARLSRWGVLDGVVAAGTPATRQVRFDAGAVVLEGRIPSVDGIDALIMDALTRQGIADALRDAELLSQRSSADWTRARRWMPRSPTTGPAATRKRCRCSR